MLCTNGGRKACQPLGGGHHVQSHHSCSVVSIGLTDESKPIRLGPKRANKIRKLFNLSKEDDVRKFVVRRKVTTKAGKEYNKAPKIQRLVTPVQLQRKRHRVALKRARAEKNKKEQASYLALVAQRAKEAKEVRQALLQRRRSSHASGHKADNN